MMKKTRAFLIVVCIASMAVPTVTLGQDGGAAPKTLASTMNVYVFPKAGQVATVQSQDEAACYSWAVENTGTDPFELAKKAQEQQAQSEQQMAQAKNAGAGAGAAGAVKGAAAGALIGEIANDDPGSGAAYGAAAGLIRGRRKQKAAQQQAVQQVEQSAQHSAAVTGEQLANFKKAFSVCLEAKDYMVKF